MTTSHEFPIALSRAALDKQRLDIWLGRSAVGGVATALATLLLLHLLRPDVSILADRVMLYANGSYSPLANLAYLTLGLGTMTLIVGIARTSTPAGRSPFGLGLLAMFGASCLLAAVFNADPPGTRATLGSLIHTKAAVFGFAGIAFAALLLPDRWRGDPVWAPVARPARLAGMVAMAGVVLTLFTPPPVNGLTQRIILAGALTWLLLVGRHLIRLAATPTAGAVSTAHVAAPVRVPSRRHGADARLAAWCGRIGLIAISYVAIVYFGFLIVRTDLSPLDHTLSEYVHGPYGGLMAGTFFAMAFGIAALALGLHRAIAPAGRSRTGLILLALAAIGVLVAGIFPVDPPASPETPSALLHGLAANLFFGCLLVAALLLPDRWHRDPRWTSAARPATAWGGIALTGLAFAILADPALGGLAQRLIFCGLLPWLLLVGWRLHWDTGATIVPA